MTIALVAAGSSLFAVAMFLLSKIPPTGVYNGWWLFGALIAIASAIAVYGLALWREWKREKAQEQENKEREQREIERHEQFKLMYGETFIEKKRSNKH